MDALVIGGTRFIGRHTVTELLNHDYDVTVFNRGNHETRSRARSGTSRATG